MEKAEKPNLLMLIALATVIAIAGLLLGYATGVISAAILFLSKSFSLGIFDEELIVSMVAFGAMFGALLGGWLSDAIGRKKVVSVSALVFILASFGLGFSQTIHFLVFSRFLIGLSIGISSTVAPMYISEIAPRAYRGALVTMNQLGITIGIFLAFLAGFFFSKTEDWRVLFLIASIPAAIQFILLFFFPESPRWYASKGHSKHAIRVLEYLNYSSTSAREEVAQMEQTIKKQEKIKKSVFQRKYIPALSAGIGITILQQITGINAVLYYSATIFQFAGFKSAEASTFATSIIGIVNVIVTILAIQVIDRLGRKPLLLSGIVGMSASLFVLGVGFHILTLHEATSNLLGWVTIVSMVFYVAFFAYSLGPGAWLINSEIYPLEVRGQAVGIATCANWAFNFIISLSFLSLVSIFGASYTFWLFAVIGIFGFWFIQKRIPETKGKSLEEIEEFWTK